MRALYRLDYNIVAALFLSASGLLVMVHCHGTLLWYTLLWYTCL